MADIGTITVPLDFTVTPASKDVLKTLIREALEESTTELPAVEGYITIEDNDALRALVRTEVDKALANVTRAIRKGTR